MLLSTPREGSAWTDQGAIRARDARSTPNRSINLVRSRCLDEFSQLEDSPEFPVSLLHPFTMSFSQCSLIQSSTSSDCRLPSEIMPMDLGHLRRTVIR